MHLFPIISGKLRKLYAEKETGNMTDLKVNKKRFAFGEYFILVEGNGGGGGTARMLKYS
jgi:hypothetical protein